MAKKKYDLITELYASAVEEVTAKPEHWMSFLRSASRNFRLPFDEQLLVHVQRPQATAVLEMEAWNRKFGRWVKRGAKGIAVIDKSAPSMRLKYYYDVSETQEGRYQRLVRPVPLWTVEDKNREKVRETLANAFGVSEDVEGFAETIREAAKNAAEDHLPDYLQDILSFRKNSPLEGVDEQSVETEAGQLLENSIAYMVMIRCGIDEREHLNTESFRNITKFRTPELVNLFGTAVRDVAEMALSEISDTIQKLQLEEKRAGRTFAGREAGRYTGLETPENRQERSLSYDDDRIQQAGRLLSAKLNRTPGAGSTPWEVWISAPNVSEGTPVRNLSESADAGKIEQPSSRDTGNGAGQDGADHEGNGQGAERDRGAESTGSAFVGTEDEQHPSGGGGDRDGRGSIQLTKEEPGQKSRIPEENSPSAEDEPVEELPWYDRSREDKSLPFFGRDEDINALLLSTPYLKASKEEIRAFYESHEEDQERTEYIKSIFNSDHTEITLEDGRRMGYKTYQNVLHMWEGEYQSKTSQSYFDWGVIAKQFEGMRLLGDLQDQAKPMQTIEGQLSFLGELAGEEAPAFSFSQEIIDAILKLGGFRDRRKNRIYSFFMQNPGNKERVKFLKNEYGIYGAYPAIVGTGIDLFTDAKGMHIKRDENEVTLKWEKAARRMEELIAAGRFLSEKELAYLPEYEKDVLAADIYRFYRNQPEEVERPYPSGSDYQTGVQEIRRHLEEPEIVGYLLESMEEVLGNTAEMDRVYPVMQKTYQDLLDYRDGVYGLASSIPAGKKDSTSMEPEQAKNLERISRIEPEPAAEQDKKDVQEPGPLQNSVNGSESKADAPVYDLQLETVVHIGTEEYEIQFLSDEMVVLHDLTYPLFTKEMPREEFDQKLWENPANDHLRQGQPLAEELPKLPVEEKQEEFVGSSDTLVQDLPAEEETPFNLAPAWEKADPLPRKVQAFDLHPEIPQAQRSQYRITNDALGHGTLKEKFRTNIAAIQLLKKCEEENRFATPDEQEILSGYVGWGSLPDAFDETKSSWSTEYLELKIVLTEEEYTAARESTLTAFYTPPVVIRSMYQALENMGLRSGNILEPSCGTGNFIGMKPESMSDCKIYGVELDSISGRIARQLYQKSAIAVQGYETAQLPDSFFDAAVWNVPFGQFKLSDKRYDKQNFLVHDYFFAKTLDKVRPGGVIAFLTSSGTMDKKNPAIRKYIAQRAELLGAIRLPNDTFQKNAGTSVTADILFLQKRDRMIEVEPDWIYLDTDENGITQNRYFVEHSEMVLGEMVLESTQYGMDSTCRPHPDRDLESLLSEAIQNIQAEIGGYEAGELVEAEDNSIPADPSVANFSYALLEGKIYYRENSRMRPVELSATAENRVKGMIAIRDCVRVLIAYQMEDYRDSVIEEQQRKLNRLYDVFQKKYGLLNARANNMAFSDDSSYPLLCSLEIVAEDGTLERKADIFTKRTIKPHQAVEKVNTASEALSLSLAEKACVDMDYMCTLTGKSMEEMEQELSGVIFRLPEREEGEPCFVSEDEYLSGNVREKLKAARRAAEESDIFKVNVEALEKVQPKDLTASEISVRLGSTWIPSGDVEKFMFELLETPNYARWHIKVHFSEVAGSWNVEGKSNDRGNVKAESTYGTKRVNAYRIMEDTLNLRDVRVYDYVEDAEGRKKAVLNKQETAVAQGKQDLIKQAFQDWIWEEPERRQRLTAFYNENFNAIRAREYDGSHLKFYGMNPEIQLRQHQVNGAARIIYGGNTLLAYE